MKPNPLLKSFSLRTFFQSCFFSTILFAIVAGFYWQAQKPGTPMDPVIYICIFAFFLLYGILVWLFQRNTLTKLLVANRETTPSKEAKPEKKPAALRETETQRDKRENKDKRLFVHLFSVLQRQGRLMDFLQEDLSLYQDAQIGTAVRSIHENCRKTVGRYLAMEPVMKNAEGERVQIDQGFDQSAIKLVGNVVGQPPFSGVLRHRGWQVKTISIPELSDKENPNIIAPAEVEIE